MGSRHYLAAGRIAALYAVVGGAWILFSDRLLLHLTDSPAAVTTLQTAKGWFFIAATAILLFIVVAGNLKKIAASEDNLRRRNEELAQAYEELTATDEELRQQFGELVVNQEKIHRQNECLLTLRETAFALMHEREVDDLLRFIIEKAAAMGGSQHAYLYTVADDGTAMELKIIVGAAIREVGFRQKPGEGVVGAVWASGQPLVVRDYQKWSGRVADPRFDVIHTSTGFPLKAGGKVIGVFGLNYFHPHELDDAEMDLFASFAEMASIALGSARLHSRLRRQQARTQALLNAMPDLIVRYSRDGILLDCKESADMPITVRLRDHIGKNINEFTPTQIAEKMTPAIDQAIATRTTQHFEYDIQDADGRTLYREVRTVAVDGDEVVGIVRDITERRAAERELKRLSLIDQATGLYNRAYFETVLRRMNDPRYLPVGVIVCDIDGLKLINETLGYAAGDGLIMSAASLVASCFREGDVVARIGGGEFAVLLPYSGRKEVENLCRSIREAVSQYRDATEMPLSISIGMSLRTSRDEKMADIFKAADRNMHREKLHSKQSGHSAIVTTLAKALEARDFVTDGHADRLQELMERLALAAGMPDAFLPDLRLLGRFHDIGKVGIPDHILFKPGRLTAEEYEIMKRHCEIGYRIALASPELAPIADWILKHQEWWNGQGYPLGLAGEDIPLPCRLLAIVDAYDAMTNDRPYRQAMSHADAVAELVRCAGRQFDARLVEEFIKIVAEN